MCVWILLIKYTNNKFLKAKWTPDIHCFLSWSISFKILSNSSLVLCGKGQEICITALTNPSISFYNPCNFDKFMKSIFQLWQIHWLFLADLTANVHFHSLCFVAVRIFHNKDNQRQLACTSSRQLSWIVWARGLLCRGRLWVPNFKLLQDSVRKKTTLPRPLIKWSAAPRTSSLARVTSVKSQRGKAMIKLASDKK